MKIFLPVLFVLSVLPVHDALARCCDSNSPRVHLSGCDSPARWGPRHDAGDARFAITTRGGGTTLLLTHRVVAVQLSARTLHQVDRKLRQERDDDEDNVLASVFKTVVLSTVRDVLDHSAECRIRELSSVDYRDGRLVFTSADGDRVFEDLEVNDEDVMQSFSERDARAFVREFRRAKDRLR